MGAGGFVHHADDFRADGTEVFSHCARSSRFLASVKVASSDSDEEDLEEGFGPFDPSEIAVDIVLLTVTLPMGPARGLCGSSGGNHGVDAGCLSSAEVREERADFVRWHRVQLPWVWGKCVLK